MGVAGRKSVFGFLLIEFFRKYKHVESGGSMSNYVFRAQPIPYDWMPEETPRSEDPVFAPDIPTYRVG